VPLSDEAREKIQRLFSPHPNLVRFARASLENDARVLRAAIGVRIDGGRPNSGIDRMVSARAGPAVQHYAIAYASDRDRGPISREEYTALVSDRGRYDFVIDGITCRCFKRASRAEAHRREAQLTVGELGLARDYIVQRRICRPIDLRRQTGSGEALTAIRLFNSMRLKVDIAKGGGHFTLFHTHKGPTTERRAFEFAAPEDVSWLLIEPPNL
jgi:hypothetical protein